MKKIDKETESKIIKAYSQGNSMRKVGNIFKISEVTVLNILRRNNITSRTKGGIYKLDDSAVIDRYIQGLSCAQIAGEFSVSRSLIQLILEKYNIPRSNVYHNRQLDRSFFDIIDSHVKAYFLGFLITDGNVGANDNSVRLDLHQKDAHILQVFANKTHNNNKLNRRKDKPHIVFHVKSTEWKKALALYGVVPKKTATVQLPLIDALYMPSLIRGMIDGDGWISSKKKQLGFCGNKKCVVQLRNFLVQKLGVYKVKVLQVKQNLWQISWGSKKDILNICNYIYANKEDCFLKRKYQQYCKIQGNTEVTTQIAKGQVAPQSVAVE